LLWPHKWAMETLPTAPAVCLALEDR
jgi:hypothetical protein